MAFYNAIRLHNLKVCIGFYRIVLYAHIKNQNHEYQKKKKVTQAGRGICVCSDMSNKKN